MAEQVKLWISEQSGTVTPLSRRPSVDYERSFEEMLIQSPDMLGEGVALVGRQLMTESGPLDLLGIDEDGKLVVYELKRGEMPREAITQAIDYASWLDSLSYDELARRISEHGPSGFTRAFDDFDDWYTGEFDEDQVQMLRPTRVVVVGLGAEPATERMAHWLADKGVNIEMLMFHAFRHGDNTIFARDVEVSSEDVRRQTESTRSDPASRAAEFQAAEVYQSAYQLFATCFAETPNGVHTYRNGVNFALPPTESRRTQRYDRYLGVYVRTDRTAEVWLVLRPHGFNAAPDERDRFLANLEQAGIYVNRSSNYDEAWIAVTAAQLESIRSSVVDFAKSVIDVWRQQYEQWLAAQSPEQVTEDTGN